MCGVAMNDFPHRFLSPADLKVVVTVCRSIFKFDLTLLKIWKKLTHRLWRDVGSHSLLWSSVKLCCHKRNLEEMPQILSSSRCHIFIHYSQNSSLTITTYKQLQSGLLWSEKSQLWPKSQKDCLIRWHRETKLITFFYLETFRSDQQQKISSKYDSSKVVHHPGLRTLSVGHVDLAGCMKYIQEFYLSIQILTNKKQFELWKTMSLTGLNIEWVVFGLEVIRGFSQGWAGKLLFSRGGAGKRS